LSGNWIGSQQTRIDKNYIENLIFRLNNDTRAASLRSGAGRRASHAISFLGYKASFMQACKSINTLFFGFEKYWYQATSVALIIQ